MGVIAGHELHPRVHHGGDEGHVAREPVQFGNDKPGLVLSAGGQALFCSSGRSFRLPVSTSVCSASRMPPMTREVAHYGGTLGLKAEARPALPIRAHPVIGDESCGFGLHLGVPCHKHTSDYL